MPETPDDPGRWIRELEERANGLREELLAWQESHQTAHQAAFDFIDAELIPQVCIALGVHEAGGTQVEMFNWQIGEHAISVTIIANPSGVEVDSTMPGFAGRLSSACARRGYSLIPVNHVDDATLMKPTRVLITRTT